MKILCIGRNYLEHAKELAHDVPKEPVFFAKAENALLKSGKPFYYPDFSKEIHYETEIVVKISRLGKNIEPKFAPRYYEEISIGIDITARDIQRNCIKKGLPWEIAKAFDSSAALGNFVSKTKFTNLNNISFNLEINDKEVQKGNTGNMIFDIDFIISYLSKFYTLKVGDLIYTGTPAGVGEVHIGDRLVASIENEKLLDFEIK